MPITLSRRTTLAGLLALGAAPAGALAVQPLAASPARGVDTNASTRWPRYRDALAIDGLGGLSNSTVSTRAGYPAATLDAVRASGLACVHITLEPVGTMASDAAFARAIADLAFNEREIDRHPDLLMRVRTAADIEAAKRTGRVGLVYGFQDGVSFETDLERLDTFHQLGVRVIQPTYNRRNLLGDGCMESANAGLSRTGIEAVERMNALGILVDLSHCGRRTSADAIRASKRPVAFTHTGCDAVAAHPRHRTDAELKSVADKGGVSGIFVMPYLSGGRQPTADDIVRHLEHAIDVAGEDHVSIGTDGGVQPELVDDAFRKRFADVTRRRREAGIAAPGETDDGYLFASDLNVPNRFELIAARLERRGHSAERIEKILGRNLLRVFADTWTPAR